MKRKEKNQYQSQTIEELKKELLEITNTLFSTSVNRYTKPSKNLRERKEWRKKIALLKGIINSRQEK